MYTFFEDEGQRNSEEKGFFCYCRRVRGLFVSTAGRSSNGRTGAFEALNLGPIPSLPAVFTK